MASTIYSEIFILIDILISYILRNHLVRHIARTAAEVAARPQVPPPKLLLDVRKFRHQMVGRLSFQPLQQPTDRHLRRDRNKQVHMLLRHMSLHDLHLMLAADIPDQNLAPAPPPLRSTLVVDTWLSKPDANGSRIRCARRVGIPACLKLNPRRAC